MCFSLDFLGYSENKRHIFSQLSLAAICNSGVYLQVVLHSKKTKKMIKWFADDTKLSTEKGKENNVLLFGGVLVDETAEQQIIDLLESVKGEYTFPICQ